MTDLLRNFSLRGKEVNIFSINHFIHILDHGVLNQLNLLYNFDNKTNLKMKNDWEIICMNSRWGQEFEKRIESMDTNERPENDLGDAIHKAVQNLEDEIYQDRL